MRDLKKIKTHRTAGFQRRTTNRVSIVVSFQSADNTRTIGCVQIKIYEYSLFDTTANETRALMLVRLVLLTHIQNWHISGPFFLLLTLLLVRWILGTAGIVLLTSLLSFFEKRLPMTLLFHTCQVLHMYTCVFVRGTT